jgi:hypothetical protein
MKHITRTFNFARRFNFISFLCCMLLLGGTLQAQTPTAFTYQGRLTDNSAPANDQYDLEFKLYNASSAGAQQGATQTIEDVQVVNGVFTVQLNFGGNVFINTSAKFIEVGVRPAASNGAFTTLTPRQPINATPYTVQTLNAEQLGGLAASQYVQTGDARLTDARIPIAGSGNYIQNTNSLQAAQFNINGNASANILNAQTQININNNRVLSVGGTNNVFAGVSAGTTTTAGNNSFFGFQAGKLNQTGSFNSLFGANSGAALTTGSNNAFFGYNAGANSTGSNSAFFGTFAGRFNTTGFSNSFFGDSAGEANTTGANNSFFGRDAGTANTTGANNSFYGARAGEANTTGTDNAIFGYFAGIANTTGKDNAIFGSTAGSQNTTGFSNSFFGISAGTSNTTGNTNAFFGRAAGFFNTTGTNNTFVGEGAGSDNTTGVNNTFIGRSSGDLNSTGDNNTLVGYNAALGSANLDHATAIGAGAIVSTSNTIVLGRTDGTDKVRVYGLGTAGSTSLCRNANNEISTCTAGNFTDADADKSSATINLLREQNVLMQQQLNRQQLLLDDLRKTFCQVNPQMEVCQQERKGK